MHRNRQDELASACAYLLANTHFKMFLDEVEERRGGVVDAAMLGQCDSYEEYLMQRARYQVFTEVLGMAEFLAEQDKALGSD